MWTIDRWIEMGINAPVVSCYRDRKTTLDFLEYLEHNTKVCWCSGRKPLALSHEAGYMTGIANDGTGRISYFSSTTVFENSVSIYDFVEISGVSDIEDFEEFLMGD